MKSLRKIGAFVATAGVVVLLALPQLASAQATRTWVSGLGDDANPCSRTAPCKTFAGAISKTATGGEINCIDSAGYGALTITKSMQIDCRDVLGGVLVAGTAGFTINAPGAQVILRHLDFNGLAGSPTTPGTIGIRIIAAASVHVEDVTIRGFNQSGIDFSPSANSQLTLVHVTSQENVQHGLSVSPTSGAIAKVAVFNSTFSSNAVNGVRVTDFGFVSLTDSVLANNASHGVVAITTGMNPAKVSMVRVTSASNANAGVIANGPGAVFYLSNVLLTGNAYGLYPPIAGGTYVSYGNNTTNGNTIADGSPTSVLSPF